MIIISWAPRVQSFGKPTQSQNKSNNRHLDLSQFNVFMVSDTQGDLLLKHKFIVSIIY